MLTKAFVVLVTVTSVLVVALLVSFVAQVEDAAAKLAVVEQQLAVANTTAAIRQSELAALQEGEKQRIALLNDQVAEWTSKVTDLQTALNKAQATALAAQANLAEQSASLKQLAAAETINAELMTAFNRELTQHRTQTVDQKTKLIQLTAQIAELEGQNAGLTRQVRLFGEQMHGLQDRNQKLEGMLAQVPEKVRRELGLFGEGAQVTAPRLGVAVSGQITQVRAAGDDVLVQINVGRNDGVAPNTEFMVHRGDVYLGTLKIETVDANAAVGRMTLVQEAVKAGDLVYAGG